MMLDINIDILREGFWKGLPLAGLVGVLMAFEMVALVIRGAAGEGAAAEGAPPAGFSNTKALGQVLYTDYVFPFEIAAVILLVAIIAAIALTLRSRKETKYQDPRVQLEAHSSGRLKVVKLMNETGVPKGEGTQ
jgi:NADH-quinone oxidoreductase subunit J